MDGIVALTLDGAVLWNGIPLLQTDVAFLYSF